MEKIFLVFTSLALGLMPVEAQVFGQEQAKDTNSLGQIPTELSWRAQKEHNKWDAEKLVIEQARIEDENIINVLQNNVTGQSQDEKNLAEELSALRKSLLDSKKFIPRDPWREIYSEKKYVNSPNSGFVRFNGQILEVAQEGIRVLGKRGDSADEEYFVFNFPYRFKTGESVDPANIYVAFEDGDFSYITEDGYAKKIPKLNYGKPCDRPKNADGVESIALQLSAQDEAKLSPIDQGLKQKHEAVIAAKKRLDEFTAGSSVRLTNAWKQLKKEQEDELKNTQDLANNNDPEALRRMGERYRDGDGVDKDLNKSAGFYKKAELVLQEDVDRQRERDRLNELASLKQRLLRNINLADKYDNVDSMLYLSKCYSNGIGTEIDLIKGAEYYDKAVHVGLPKLPNRAQY
jgi:TPR repeat protein